MSTDDDESPIGFTPLTLDELDDIKDAALTAVEMPNLLETQRLVFMGCRMYRLESERDTLRAALMEALDACEEVLDNEGRGAMGRGRIAELRKLTTPREP